MKQTNIKCILTLDLENLFKIFEQFFASFCSIICFFIRTFSAPPLRFLITSDSDMMENEYHE